MRPPLIVRILSFCTFGGLGGVSVITLAATSAVPATTDTDVDDVVRSADAGVDDGEPRAIGRDATTTPAKTDIASVTPALALARLKAALAAVNSGKSPKSGDIDALFSVPLDSPEGIRERAKRLPSEIRQMEERVAQLKEQLDTPERLAPPIAPPQVLSTPPVAPTPPEVSLPAEPQKPTRAEIRAYTRQKHPEPETDPRLLYEKAAADYAQAVEKKEAAEAKFAADTAAYEAAAATYRTAKDAFETARHEREQEIRGKVAAITKELYDLRSRITVAKYRNAYLNALEGVLGELSGPGLEMFQLLKAQRTAIRNRAETVARLEETVQGLAERVKVLYHRAEAGSLVGFLVQQRDVSDNLGEEVRAFEQRLERAGGLSKELIALAEEIEADSRSQRAFILTRVMASDRSSLMDKAFQDRLRESRRASRVPTGFAVTETELVELGQRFASLIPRPKSLSTVAEGEKTLLEIRGAGEQLDRILNVIYLGRDRYRQAYKREIVTIFSSLASPEVKERAYSFSYAFFEDVIADINLLRVDLSLWAEERLGSVSRVSENLRTGEGKLKVLRITAGMVLILLLVGFRRRIRRGLARTILRLVNVRVFKSRAGLLARLTVFVLALLPIATVGLSGYALFYLIGIDYPEVQIAEIAFRWGLFYLVGRQFVIGMTKRERSGRPPLFDISDANFELLRMTYARLGLFLAVAAAGDEVSREWIGTGSLNTLVRFAVWVWLLVWLVWAIFAWRRSLAISCGAQVPADSILGRMANVSGRRIVGVVFTPSLFLWLVTTSVIQAFRRLLAEGNLLAYIRAKTLRRLSRKNKVVESTVPALALPEKYVAQFPLYPLHGEEGEVLLPRGPQLERVLSQVAHWRATRQDGSLVLVGEKGIGKTTFLALLEREIPGIRTTRKVFAEKLRSEADLVASFARSEGIDAGDVGRLAQYFNEQEEQVVLLDEAHNIFLRTVGGFRAVDALVSLVDATSDKVFWVLVFNSYSWSFLSKVNKHVQAFRKVLRLPPWSQGELKALVAKRNERSGVEVEFDEVLLDAEASSTGGFELISGADGFFRLLWEASRGNPRVATYLWLNALTARSASRIRVGLIREEDADFFDDLGSGMRFALASLAQHENLSFGELAKALNVPSDEAVHAARFLLEYGLIETKHTDKNRYTLAPRFHQQVIRTLRSNHLLFLEEL